MGGSLSSQKLQAVLSSFSPISCTIVLSTPYISDILFGCFCLCLCHAFQILSKFVVWGRRAQHFMSVRAMQVLRYGWEPSAPDSDAAADAAAETGASAAAGQRVGESGGECPCLPVAHTQRCPGVIYCRRCSDNGHVL